MGSLGHGDASIDQIKVPLYEMVVMRYLLINQDHANFSTCGTSFWILFVAG